MCVSNGGFLLTNCFTECRITCVCEMVGSSQQKVLLSAVSRVCVCGMVGLSQEKILPSAVSRVCVCVKTWVSLK